MLNKHILTYIYFRSKINVFVPIHRQLSVRISIIICICLLLYDRYCIFVHCNHHFDTRKRLHPLNTGDASPSIRALDQATLHFMDNCRVVFSFTKKEISTRQGQYLFLFYNSIIRFTVFPSHKLCFLRSFPVTM